MKNKKSESRKPAKTAVSEVKTQPEGASPQALCPVVGFGASAGGLEAFQEILAALPVNTGLAFVFVQHLDPNHPSILGELLAKGTKMPVVQVRNQMVVEPNQVYVIPPNVGMRLSDGKLLLTERTSGFGPHLPIDEFFRSLAEERGGRAIAVLLSGTASDGTLGLRAVKEAGGITFAQDQSAKFDAMPRNAIAAGWVDLVMPPTQIANEILRISQHPYVAAPEAVAEEPEIPESVPGPARFEEVIKLLRSATGVDFTLYKRGTLQRRILRRMAVHKIETVAEYVRLLRDQRAELKALFHDILIGVTGFFRENATFDALKKTIFPAIFHKRSAESPVRFWVAGCSTGEEAYSLAICLLEYMRESDTELPVQIFGTDLNEPALILARAGVYPESIATDVSPERLRRFFTRVDGQYQISRPVRDMCVFAQQNLIKDPPFSKLDLITCRNVLIYLGPALQSKVLRLFHYALKPTGYLVLGLSETVGSSDQFGPLDHHLRIFSRKIGNAAVNQVDFGTYEDVHLERAARHPASNHPALDAERRVEQIILSRYSPPAVLITEEGSILQFHGHTPPYLEHSSGEPTLNITRMLRPELLVEFRKLFERARKKHVAVGGDLVRISHLNHNYVVRLSVTPMVSSADSASQYLVLFEEYKDASEKQRRESKPDKHSKISATSRRIRELEEELAWNKQQLEAVTEEQQAATEELKSANEEVQSSNEELQSTNEELLTAKEELQSTNEELTTVNEEMNSRNVELSQVNNDLNNLLSSVNIPIVMLGNDLKIRRFTPQAEKVLNLLPTDVGRPLSDFKPKIDIPDLEQLFLDVIENLHVKEREVQDREGRWFSMWVRPYRTADNKIDGAVMVLFDVTDRKHAAEARYRRLFEGSKDGILIADADTGAILDVNPYLVKTFAVSRSHAIGMKYWELDLFRGTSLDGQSLNELHNGETVEKLITARVPGGGHAELEVLGNVYPEGERRAIQLNIRDVTERKRNGGVARREPGQAPATQRLDAIGRLAGGVAEDFSNQLGNVIGYADLLKQRLGSEDPASGKVMEISHVLERASVLARQLLMLSGQRPARVEVLNLNDVVAALEPVIRIALPHNIELRIECETELPEVRADRGQLEQLIVNLALNAQESVPGGGWLRVRTYAMQVDEAYSRRHPAVNPGAYSVLELWDTRPGLQSESLADGVPPGGSRGSAMSDIATIASAVRQYGGLVWAASELGRGTTFRIFLPQITN